MWGSFLDAFDCWDMWHWNIFLCWLFLVCECKKCKRIWQTIMWSFTEQITKNISEIFNSLWFGLWRDQCTMVTTCEVCDELFCPVVVTHWHNANHIHHIHQHEPQLHVVLSLTDPGLWLISVVIFLLLSLKIVNSLHVTNFKNYVN